ncbi:MAG TPA: preprotein translocase subunit YajC [Gemmatimonadaceae bacterium]|jgi:preprotein translocase subunit YajC|nr:preprotein translocase subunit YajC [Gemmatimonadaceae bacterium]
MTTLDLPMAFAAALQAAPSGGGGSYTPFLFEIAAFAAIFYFIILRPQQKQRREHETSLKSLKKGDEIVTAGGIVGEVIHIRETSKDGGANRLDDRVTIKSGESRIVVERGRIARIVGASAATPSSTPSQSS